MDSRTEADRAAASAPQSGTVLLDGHAPARVHVAESAARVALRSSVRLGLALGITWLIVVVIMRGRGHQDATLVATVAALLCGVSGVAGAVAGRQSPGKIEAHWLHLSAGLRMGIPLFGLLLAYGFDRSLIERGLPVALLPFFGVTLSVETLASLRELRQVTFKTSGMNTNSVAH